MTSKKIINTGNAVVDEIGTWNITGNVTPHNWYKWLLRDNGKPYFLAAAILSEIVYWYRPSEIRDEQTGAVIAYKKRFKEDKLQKSYQQISDWCGEGKATVKRAIDCLEASGVITREFREIRYGNGQVLNNVMFLSLNVEDLYRITFTSNGIDKSEDTLPTNLQGDSEQICEETPDRFAETNTENTTEITNREYNNPINLSVRDETKVDRMDEIAAYRELVKDNLDYDDAMQILTYEDDRKRFDEIYEIICDVVCMKSGTVRIGGENKPYELVKSVFLKLTYNHIEYVMQSMDKTVSKIGNIRNYLLTALYRSMQTMENAMSQEVKYGQNEFVVNRSEGIVMA
ncbi:MAG: DUF6017 domain-containing protein [Lachnospiraceae bacterium]|nr:DUF6017 domain-containing protein [Lachnospiraceae bacterium]